MKEINFALRLIFFLWLLLSFILLFSRTSHVLVGAKNCINILALEGGPCAINRHEVQPAIFFTSITTDSRAMADEVHLVHMEDVANRAPCGHPRHRHRAHGRRRPPRAHGRHRRPGALRPPVWSPTPPLVRLAVARTFSINFLHGVLHTI